MLATRRLPRNLTVAIVPDMGGDMNKSELIKVFGERFNTPDDEATDFVNAFFDVIRQSLIAGDRVEIRGFGSFAMKDYEGYTGRNPKTGVTVTVGPKKLPFFRAGRKLKEQLNEDIDKGSAADSRTRLRT